jgi:V/A-type H+-transporting ATPase subunit E
MEQQNPIIQRILSDADAKAAEIVATAHAKADSLVANNNARISELRQNLLSKCDQNRAEMVKNALSNAQLDVRKYRLKAKQAVVADAYEAAYRQLLSLPEKDYVTLLERLLKKYASSGEVVRVSQKDSALVSAAFLSKLNLNLRLGAPVDIDGGFILEGNGYDKNLSLKVLVDSTKEKTETELSKILFGKV